MKGESDAKKLCWTDSERRALSESASPLIIDFLNPDDPITAIPNSEVVFGRDLFQIRTADFIVVDARERRGIGIGIEIMASRIFGTPLIAVVPRNTYYRMNRTEGQGSMVENYVHPHLAVLADIIVDSFDAAGRWISKHSSTTIPKPIEILEQAIECYSINLLPFDKSMQDVLGK